MQLSHDSVETTWEKHGWVELSLGDITLRSEMYQHNRKYHQAYDDAAALVGELKSKLESALKAVEVHRTPSADVDMVDVSSSTAAAVA